MFSITLQLKRCMWLSEVHISRLADIQDCFSFMLCWRVTYYYVSRRSMWPSLFQDLEIWKLAPHCFKQFFELFFCVSCVIFSLNPLMSRSWWFTQVVAVSGLFVPAIDIGWCSGQSCSMLYNHFMEHWVLTGWSRQQLSFSSLLSFKPALSAPLLPLLSRSMSS